MAKLAYQKPSLVNEGEGRGAYRRIARQIYRCVRVHVEARVKVFLFDVVGEAEYHVCLAQRYLCSYL
jgi:hypothetical protein